MTPNEAVQSLGSRFREYFRLTEDPDPVTRIEVRRFAIVLAAGFFSTTLAQPEEIELPLQILLKNEVKLEADEMSLFFSVGALAWYCKPLAGILSDSYPLFGTRRRSYILLGAVTASACWLIAGIVPTRYAYLLAIVLMINAGLVIASSAVGGLFVEVGEKYAISDRLVPMRYIVQKGCFLASGPLGGWLAIWAFGWSTIVSAVIALVVVPITFLLLRESDIPAHTSRTWKNAAIEIRSLLRAQGVWLVAGLLFLANAMPNFHGTALFYYRTGSLGFTPDLIGHLKAAGGIAGLGAALAYALARRRWSLQSLIIPTILCNAAGSLLYLWYASKDSAVLIDAGYGFLATLVSLALMELAVSVSPRGSEAFAFALLVSVLNISYSVSDYSAAWLYKTYNEPFFPYLVWIRALGTAMVVLVVPFVMRQLSRE